MSIADHAPIDMKQFDASMKRKGHNMTVTKATATLHPRAGQTTRHVELIWDKTDGWTVAIYFQTKTAGYIAEKKWGVIGLSDGLTRFRKVIIADEGENGSSVPFAIANE